MRITNLVLPQLRRPASGAVRIHMTAPRRLVRLLQQRQLPPMKLNLLLVFSCAHALMDSLPRLSSISRSPDLPLFHSSNLPIFQFLLRLLLSSVSEVLLFQIWFTQRNKKRHEGLSLLMPLEIPGCVRCARKDVLAQFKFALSLPKSQANIVVSNLGPCQSRVVS